MAVAPRRYRTRATAPEVHWGEVAGYALLALGLFLFWNTIAVYPLKILVVFFHEMSHGLAAVLTGGRIVEIRVNAFQGGLCIVQGGNRLVILSAGYLGSLMWGGLILIAAARTERPSRLTLALGLLLLLVTVVYVRPVPSFGFAFGALTAATLILAAVRVGHDANRVVLKIIGLTSCIYAILDIKSDVLAGRNAPSDAAMLGDLTGVPTLVWGVFWVALAVVAAAYFLAEASRPAK